MSEEVDLNALVERQKCLIHQVTKTLINFKKDSAPRKTELYFRFRLETINTARDEFRENDRQLVLWKLPPETEYLAGDWFEEF